MAIAGIENAGRVSRPDVNRKSREGFLDKTERQLIGRQKALIEMGSYSFLSGPEYQSELDLVYGKCTDGEQARLRGMLTWSWVTDQAHFIENHPDRSNSDEMQGLERWKFALERDGYKQAYDQMFDVFKNTAKFQATVDTKYLKAIEKSELFSANSGILRLKTPKGLGDSSVKNSPIQYARMFLLGIRGLSPSKAEKIVDYVKSPPNVSRSITGKLPAGIIAMGARLGLDWADKANYGWPSPGNEGEDKYKLVTEEKLGWNQPRWLNPDDGLLYDAKQNVVVVQKPKLEQKVKPVTEGWVFDQSRLIQWASILALITGALSGKL